MSNELELGRIVYSVAGHDKGKYYVVVKAEQNGYVYIADGRLRKLSSPKRKSIKHVRAKCDIITELGRKLEEQKPIFDHELRKSLDEYSQNTYKEG